MFECRSWVILMSPLTESPRPESKKETNNSGMVSLYLSSRKMNVENISHYRHEEICIFIFTCSLDPMEALFDTELSIR